MLKNLPANAGHFIDTGSIPVLGRSPGEGNGNPLQHSCLRNPMDRGARWGSCSPRGRQEPDTTQQLSTGILKPRVFTSLIFLTQYPPRIHCCRNGGLMLRGWGYWIPKSPLRRELCGIVTRSLVEMARVRNKL